MLTSIKNLIPSPDITKQVKIIHHLELVFEGTSWYHVKVCEK